MLDIKAKKPIPSTEYEQDDGSVIRMWQVEAPPADEPAWRGEANMYVCDCSDMKRNRICKHFADYMGKIPFRTFGADGHHRLVIPLWGASETRPWSLANLAVNNSWDDRIYEVLISKRGTVNDTPVDLIVQVATVLPVETIKGVRTQVIEWLSSLPYTEPDELGCSSPYHKEGQSAFEMQQLHTDENGQFSRLFLADLLEVYTTGTCIDCHLAAPEADFDDEQKIWK